MSESVGLMDLRPATSEVPIQGATVTVRAVPISAISALLTRYPVVRKLFNGGDVSKDFSFEGAIAAAPEAMAFLIAAGFNSHEDPKAVAHAKTLGLGDQIALLEGIVNATLEGGMAPFVARVTRILSGFGVGLPEGSASPTEDPVST